MSERLNVCGATRILIPAFFVGMAVTSYSGNETLAWIAAGVVALAIWAIGRVRGTTTTCAVSTIPDRSVDDRRGTSGTTIDIPATDPGTIRIGTDRGRTAAVRTPQRKGA